MTGLKKPKASAAPTPAPVPDEIDQIMNEIEELQQEMNAAPETKSAPAAKLKVVPAPAAAAEPAEEDALAEFHAQSGDVGMEDALADLKDDSESSGHSILDQAIEQSGEGETEDEREQDHDAMDGDEMSAEAEASHEDSEGESGQMMDSDSGEHGTLTMSLTGNMTLKLKYECNGQEVTVGFAENCLKVQLADGTEFKVPVTRSTAAPMTGQKKGSRRAA